MADRFELQLARGQSIFVRTFDAEILQIPNGITYRQLRTPCRLKAIGTSSS